MNLNIQIAKSRAEALNNELSVNNIQNLLEKPKKMDLGDLAFPCFTHAIASDIKNTISCDSIQEVQVVGGYVNIFYQQATITQQFFCKIVKEKNFLRGSTRVQMLNTLYN